MRILCLGEALVDLVCRRPVASLAEADAFVPCLGGAAATVAVVAARRGADVALAGGAGDDAWGAWLVDRLNDEGVELEHFAQDDALATPVAFVTVDEHAQPAAALHGSGSADGVAALGTERALAAVDAADALFLTSTTLAAEPERDVTLAARERALRDGKPVVFDADFRAAQWRTTSNAVEVAGPLADRAFLVRANAEEARALTGETDPAAAAQSLLAAGAQHVVITLGAGGALLAGGGLDRAVPAAPATPVDTTGAGAAVTGVLLAALARTGFYPASIAAMLPDAMAEAARATERYGSLSG